MSRGEPTTAHRRFIRGLPLPLCPRLPPSDERTRREHGENTESGIGALLDTERGRVIVSRMIELGDEDLHTRLRNFEDPFVERKAGSDINDCLKTAVAFANSLPIDAPGVLFVPVSDKGTIQPGQDLEKLQRTISERINRAYPPIKYLQKILGSGSDQFLAGIIWGSAARPHFAGPSYVRDGAETKIASEKQFEELIATRQSKVYEILRWKGRAVSLIRFQVSRGVRRGGAPIEARVEDCNQFFVALRLASGDLISEPTERVTINYDHRADRLLIEAEMFV